MHDGIYNEKGAIVGNRSMMANKKFENRKKLKKSTCDDNPVEATTSTTENPSNAELIESGATSGSEIESLDGFQDDSEHVTNRG